MTFLFVLLSYIAVGTAAALWLRWPSDDEGLDLLLDVTLWPVLIYFIIRDGNE